MQRQTKLTVCVSMRMSDPRSSIALRIYNDIAIESRSRWVLPPRSLAGRDGSEYGVEEPGNVAVGLIDPRADGPRAAREPRPRTKQILGVIARRLRIQLN